MIKERRIDAERLARVENDVAWLKEEQKNQSKIIGKTADDVTDIKFLLAKQEGQRTVIRWMSHAAGVIIGIVGGFIGGSAK